MKLSTDFAETFENLPNDIQLHVDKWKEVRKLLILIGYWWERQKERDHCEDQDVGQWTILKWILERQDGMVWIGLIWLRIGTSGGTCEHGIEPSVSVKCWEILEWLHNW
jgi:hypothetical protein